MKTQDRIEYITDESVVYKKDSRSENFNSSNMSSSIEVQDDKPVKMKKQNSVLGVDLTKRNKILLAALAIAIFAFIICLSIHIRGKINSEVNKTEEHSNKCQQGQADSSAKIAVASAIFGNLADNSEVKKYVLRNRNSFEVSLISFGAAVQSIKLKDKNGKLVNVVLGLNTLEEYRNRTLNPYFGSIIGRTANRIANSQFKLNGVQYNLERNNGQNNLHGGLNGFDMRNWNSSIEDDGIKFSLLSKNNEGGYPGEVSVDVSYKLDAFENRLTIEYKAKTTQPTPLDLTNHAYFNLNGHDSGIQIYNHEFKLFSDNYLGFSTTDLIVTGVIKPVNNTKYDFRSYTKLADRIRENALWPQEGFDNFFIINQQSGTKYVASVRNPSNGLRLDIFSDQNGVQFYTSNFLNITIPSTGLKYGIHNGFCLETHNYPDSVNHFTFPSSIVIPEGEYSQKTIWLFKNEG